MKQSAAQLRRMLEAAGDPEKAVFHQRFFKTGPGEYGEGDRFRGVKVPVLRKLCREYQSLATSEVVALLKSDFHEDRLLALIILVRQFERGDDADKKRIYDLYLANTKYINNWDMVDCSAPNIVGAYLRDRSRLPIHRMAKSTNLWERRIAALATFHFIRHNEFDDCLRVAKTLLTDEEDLIHKAVGWMLREIGSRDIAVEEEFLRLHYKTMPRTMLRYAIEKFSEPKRKQYLKR
jgi:3-methyladenine DNA glycosylase AlkD